MDVDQYGDAEMADQHNNEGMATMDMMEDPYAAAHTVYDDEMNLDEMPVTQEDAWAVIRWVCICVSLIVFIGNMSCC